MIPELNSQGIQTLEVISLFLGFAIVALLGMIAYRHIRGIK